MKKIAYLAKVVAMSSVLTLTGCISTNTTQETAQEPVVVDTTRNVLEYYIEEPEVEIKDVHEHVLYKTYSVMQYNGSNRYFPVEVAYHDQGSFDVPEGYEILSVTGVSNTVYSKYNGTTDYVIWFTNTEPVEVKPVYNEETKCYDYSDFGTPIELETEFETEDIAKTIKK